LMSAADLNWQAVEAMVQHHHPYCSALPSASALCLQDTNCMHT
jgi:hypothetical protein